MYFLFGGPCKSSMESPAKSFAGGFSNFYHAKAVGASKLERGEFEWYEVLDSHGSLAERAQRPSATAREGDKNE